MSWQGCQDAQSPEHGRRGANGHEVVAQEPGGGEGPSDARRAASGARIPGPTERASSARRSPPSTALPATWPASACRVSAVTARHHSPRRIAAASALPRSNQGEPADSGPVRTYIATTARENATPEATAPVMGWTTSGRRTSGGFSHSNAAAAVSARAASFSSIWSAQCASPTRRSSWGIPACSRTSERSIARRKSLDRRRSTRAEPTGARFSRRTGRTRKSDVEQRSLPCDRVRPDRRLGRAAPGGGVLTARVSGLQPDPVQLGHASHPAAPGRPPRGSHAGARPTSAGDEQDVGRALQQPGERHLHRRRAEPSPRHRTAPRTGAGVKPPSGKNGT